MIYLFSGDDTKKKINSYDKFIESLPLGIETFSIIKNDFDPVQIESFYSSFGLFFDKCVVFFDNIFEREEIKDFVLSKLDLMQKSVNIFVFLEGRLDKDTIDVFKKARAEINLFELPKEKLEKFDNFLVANAFAGRDKLNMWIYFRQAMDLKVGMEELIGVLFWKVKDMLIKKNFYKFKEEELKIIAGKLSYLLPEARKNGIEDEAAFEQFLLEIF